MPKSENKDALRDLFPSVFVNEYNPEYTKGMTYAIEDGMIQLQSFCKKEGRSPTGREVLRYMLRNAMFYLDKTPARVYVLMLDKLAFVYKIKGIEHKRRARKRTTVPAPDPQKGENLLPLDSPMPYNWTSMMANRYSY